MWHDEDIFGSAILCFLSLCVSHEAQPQELYDYYINAFQNLSYSLSVLAHE